MITKLILWFLGLFGYGKEAAAVAAYQAEDLKEQAAAVAAVQEREGKIDAAVAEKKAEVAAGPDAGLDAELDGVLDAGERANRNRTPRS
ncbi:MAG: hypothetical protein WCA44_11480 [Acidobacteriaceae bacterium]